LEALYVLVITAGLRQGEILGLQWDDVNLEGVLNQIKDLKDESKPANVVYSGYEDLILS
jgi:integrase